jgi:tau tubulin kinase
VLSNLPGQSYPIHYILMELLGYSLTTLRKTNPFRRFSVGTALRVGSQCLEAIESLHKCGYLHRQVYLTLVFDSYSYLFTKSQSHFRDIKPSNMCTGLPQWGRQKMIYLIDFGMARKFLQPDGGLRSERGRAAFRGTTRYVSVAVHERRETVS